MLGNLVCQHDHRYSSAVGLPAELSHVSGLPSLLLGLIGIGNPYMRRRVLLLLTVILHMALILSSFLSCDPVLALFKSTRHLERLERPASAGDDLLPGHLNFFWRS